MVQNGPCGDWTTVDAVLGRPGNAALDADVVAEAVQVASDLLFRLGGHRWPGVCERTVRPVSRTVAAAPDFVALQTVAVTSGWGVPFVWGGCLCNRRPLTAAEHTPSIELGAYPILAVSEVTVDGDVLPTDEYRIDDLRWLTRLPAAGSTVNEGWPCGQRLDLPDTERGTWSVTFTYGGAPPASGVAAATALAGELARLWDPAHDGDCALDPSVTSVTREGITLDVESTVESGRDTGFGLLEVRAFLEAVNPDGLRRRPQVINPDRLSKVVRAGAAAGS